jgi:SAM-dependent methyltransferase
MVTIPPQGDETRTSDRTSPDDEQLFREAERQLRGAGGSFGADAERYDRARPTYPEAMVEAIVAASPGRAVLDVGIGTGIAARLFKARGCDVLGVDVDDRMAQIARRHGIDVEIATFEEWNPGGRVFSAVVSAQTWHWIDPVAGASKAAEALEPGGRIALCWNVFQPPTEIAETFSEVSRGILPASAPDVWKRPAMEGYAMLARRAEEGLRESRAFTAPEQWQFDWHRTYSTDEWLDQLPTSGGFDRIPPDQVDRLLAKTGAAIDALGGEFVMHYSTMVVTAVKKTA